jgi:hypothetical protein
MARQPTPRKYFNKPRSMYAPEKLSDTLASLVGQCASAATCIEVELSLCMGALLGAENAASVAVFTAMKNTKVRREALASAARSTLGADDLELYNALSAEYERLDSFRNDVIHGMWGSIEGVDDASLWCSTEYYAVWHITDYHKGEVGSLTGEWRQEKFNQLYLWKHSDISSSIDELKALARCVGHFHSYLRYKHRIQGQPALDRLMSEPLFQKALVALRTQAGKS